jgi:cytochrome oxidase Cu insertion factor (SCO1/SenC/PrrC family)
VADSAMIDSNDELADVLGGLSDGQRAAIFNAANEKVDRRAALRAGRVPIPPKFVLWTVAVLVALALGGEIVDHYYGTFGGATTASSIKISVLPVTSTTNVPNAPNLITLETYMGLKFIGSANAGSISLTNQRGQKWNLASQTGKVVVLTFYNSICNDICPVLGAELREAHQLLGRESSKVEFAVVNTDPNHLSISPLSPALREPDLSKIATLSFLTGSVQALDRVWTTYGVQIKVGAKASQVSHNNVLYFIGAKGELVAYATPFATVSTSGHYSSNASSIHLYAQAIAETAVSLVP